MKKVLGLVVSNRKLGNSEILVKEIMRNIPGDCQRQLIRVTDLKLEACKACYHCLQPDAGCKAHDDFNFIMDSIKKADAVIIGVPVYILGPHGYFKLLQDRLVGAYNYTKFTAGKPCVIVVPFGTIGWTGYSKAAVNIFPRTLEMKLIDTWMVHATLPAESLLDEKNLAYARDLGQRVFGGEEYRPGRRECPQCGSDIFRLLDGNRVECPICDAVGVLGEDSIPDFSACTHNRFSHHEIEEHFHEYLAQMRARFKAEKDILKGLQKEYKEMDWWIKP
ncbi:MAG: NAD(P)H-dependent oxidoreductase [Syntrophomonadaceae bacterium]